MSDWKCYTDGCFVVTEYAGQISRKRCQPKNVGRANETTGEQQAEKEAASKIAKQAKTARKGFFKMKATKYDPKKSGPGTAQPKLDGIGASAYWEGGRICLQSSGGDDLQVEHIRDQVAAFLPRGHHVDGEFYVHGIPLQTLNSLVKKDQLNSTLLQFWVYESSTGFDWRQEAQGTHIVRTPTYYVHNDDGVQGIWKFYTDRGYEGAMYRPAGALYEQCPGSKRSRSIQKVKQMQHAEFMVCGYSYGHGKNEKIPTFRLKLDPAVRDSPSNTFTCNGAGSLAEQAAIDADSCIGQMMRVQFFCLSNRGCPILPTKGVIRPEGF